MIRSLAEEEGKKGRIEVPSTWCGFVFILLANVDVKIFISLNVSFLVCLILVTALLDSLKSVNLVRSC